MTMRPRSFGFLGAPPNDLFLRKPLDMKAPHSTQRYCYRSPASSSTTPVPHLARLHPSLPLHIPFNGTPKPAKMPEAPSEELGGTASPSAACPAPAKSSLTLYQLPS